MGFGQDPSITFLIAAVVFFIVGGGVLFVLWIATPFSVFGVKGLLMRLIEEQKETNRILNELVASVRSGRGAGEGGPDHPDAMP